MEQADLSFKRRLTSLKPGEGAVIDSIEARPEVRVKLLEMGVGPGEIIHYVRKAPFGGPMILELMNYRLALRESEAHTIFVKTNKPQIFN